ncbi:hypothetical protein [Deinococcus humi]|uniref:Outer membrane protein assembly factor BamB n=1 Tax=Deinococcus humi TaxID=662880 RepID=A0A7W8JV99_9DEIO|nr:hypothetical protein [Deinococcus humi]MBB5363784.1 outer membrane protein assembly factor BamB [Deinococcus humi]
MSCNDGSFHTPPVPVPITHSLISTEQRLFAVNLSAVNDVVLLPSPVPRTSFVDMARDGDSGPVYGITNSSLHALNVSTGAEAWVGSSGVHDLTALAFDRSGRLFAGSASGHLYQLDMNTGAASPVPLTSRLGAVSGDLAAAPDGTLYGTITAPGSDVLVSIHVDSGVVTTLGPTGYTQVYGLTFRGEILYGITSGGELLTLDRHTGEAQQVGDTGLRAVTGME